MAFQPTVGEALAIEGIEYRIAEHPAAPGMPYGQEGRQAVVYQLVAGNERRALKVFKPSYRIPGLVALARQLEEYAAFPGLGVCKRTVLTGHRNKPLLRQHSDLTYAVLMPWIEGPTWMQVLLERRALTPEQSLHVARAFVDVLATMEEHGLAHCDLSGPNVMLPMLAGADGVALVDVEQMYGPELRRPRSLPGGSPGYAHRTAPEGLWSEDADRFGGAVLVAEMLGWCDQRVREAAWGENYFDPQEMQRDCDRYRLLAEVLEERWVERVSRLFERAWRADALTECATPGEWLVVLPEAVPEQVRAGKPVQAVAQRADQRADADTIQAWMELGRRFEEQGRLDNALETYRQADAHAAEGSGLHEELALIIAELEARLKAAHQAVSADPVAALFSDGLAAYESQEWGKAKELLSEVVRRQPDYELGGQRAGTLLRNAEHRLSGRRSPAVLVALLVMAIAVVAVSLTYQRSQDTARSQATATAQARLIARVGATVESQETATVLGQATSTAEVQLTATAAADATVTSQAKITAHAEQTMTAATVQLHATETALSQAAQDFVATREAMPTSTPQPTREPKASATRVLDKAGITLIYVPAGEFLMGSSDSDPEAYSQEKPQHRVYVDGFYIGRTEVTNAQYERFMEAGGYSQREYWTEEGWQWREDQRIVQPGCWNDTRFNGPEQPVLGVSWYEADAYARWSRGRLPTDAEWEYAARGGPLSRGYRYAGSDDANAVAWYWENSGQVSHAVGEKQANELGLYDMSGNALEWCADWYDSGYYTVSAYNNPQGPASGSYRVLRGGSWQYERRWVRCAFSGHNTPNSPDRNYGFRVVVRVAP